MVLNTLHIFMEDKSIYQKLENMDAQIYNISRQRSLFRDVSKNSQVWMSHADTILTLLKDLNLSEALKMLLMPRIKFWRRYLCNSISS